MILLEHLPRILFLLLTVAPINAIAGSPMQGLGEALSEIGRMQLENKNQEERAMRQMELEHQQRMELQRLQSGLPTYTHEQLIASINNVINANVNNLMSLTDLEPIAPYECSVTISGNIKQGLCTPFFANINNSGLKRYDSYIVDRLIYWDENNYNPNR